MKSGGLQGNFPTSSRLRIEVRPLIYESPRQKLGWQFTACCDSFLALVTCLPNYGMIRGAGLFCYSKNIIEAMLWAQTGRRGLAAIASFDPRTQRSQKNLTQPCLGLLCLCLGPGLVCFGSALVLAWFVLALLWFWLCRWAVILKWALLCAAGLLFKSGPCFVQLCCYPEVGLASCSWAII